jgi:spore coat polysaccharide biosynthesis protein SpsF
MNTSSCRIVIQARLSSSRLPAKSLLPVTGIPVAALCALRAANHGGEVVVATSSDPSDDVLATKLAEYSIDVVRGPLHNVLARFVLATADLAACDVVVRLTADNVVPDGEFIDTLVREFRSANADYLGTHFPFDGLPYGVSAEVFTARVLRDAAEATRTTEEREHVTLWIRSHGISKYATRSMFALGKRYDHLRCTIDSLEDYVRVAKLFDTMNGDPIKIPWRTLIEAFALVPGTPQFRIPCRAGPRGLSCGVLSLGTAQFGIPYGVTNKTGQPSHDEATRMIRAAVDHGVTFIDTARAYGAAESRIAAALVPGYMGRATVGTKLDTLSSLVEGASDANVTGAVDASVLRSCRELRTQHLDVLLLHRWAHRRQFSEAVWRRLLELQEGGVIGALGASVYSPVEAIEALRDKQILHLQLPYNLLDWRWNSEEFLEARTRRPDVSVHIRSVFLQGLLVSDAPTWPSAFVNADEWIGRLDQAAAELRRDSRADLCMAYATGAEWVTTVLIGIETERQLHDNLSLALRPPLEADERVYLQGLFGKVPERLLNPAMWVA